MLTVLVLGGCCCVPDKAGPPEPSYCRKFPANAPNGEEIKSWLLLELSDADLVSVAGSEFVIIDDFNPKPGSALTINEGDGLVFAGDAGARTLTHYDENGKLKARVEKLVLHDRKLWANGDVFDANGINVGVYFVYRTEDRRPCENVNAFDMKRCREFHFEYFATGDAADELPSFEKNIDKAVNGTCSGPLETDEGDGDEGRRR